MTHYDRENSSTLRDIAAPIGDRTPFFWFVILAGLLFIGYGIFAASMIFKYYKLDKYGYTTSPGKRGVVVASVDPDGPAAGKLQPGDSILAINGDTQFSRITQFFPPTSALEGDSVQIKIERNGVQREVKVGSQFYPASQTTYDSRWKRVIAYLPRSLACLIVALLIGLLKPEDNRARIGALAFLAISHQALSYTLTPIRSLFDPAEDLIAYFFVLIQGSIWYGPLAYHASYDFMQGIPKGRFWSLLNRLLYATGALLFLNRLMITSVTQTTMAVQFRSQYYQIERVFSNIENWYWSICLIAISAVLIRNNRVVREPELRRRIGLVLYGTLIVLLPQTAIVAIARIATVAGYQSFANSPPFETLRLVSSIGMTLIPICWGYAILRQQVYDINVVVRRSVQYLLAQNALRLFLVLPIIGVSYVVVTKSDRSLRELTAYLLYDNPYYLLLIIAAALSLIFRSRLQDWIDRKFFREAYQQDKILRELSEEVRKLDSMSEMSRLVSQKVDEALHPERLYLFYREEDKLDLSLGFSTGGQKERLRIPEEFELLRVMENHTRAIDFPFPPKIKLPDDEKEWLTSMGTRLVVPMNGSEGRLAGLLILGPKKSEAPYTGSDRQLLDSLAGQIAIVYENARLKERVARERKIQHEVLARFEEKKLNLLKECPTCGACYDSSEQTCARDESELRLSLPVERTIEGRYRLDKLLGKGGMGAVYEASDARLNRSVAVKILAGRLFGNPDALRRFQREAQASARLNHLNIVAVHDYGALSSEGAYLVMELLRGETLAQVLRKRKYLEPGLAADWFDQVFSAMEAAHGAGIIHRDLKPENIFIAQESGASLSAGENTVIKVLDFGIAKFTQLEAPSNITAYQVTSPGTVLGTFGYMSPEQWTGDPVDERSDIYSLGVIVVKALTGQRPFTGKTYHELMTAIMSRTYHFEGDSPELKRLDVALQKCLAKDKKDRFSSVAEMRKVLLPAIRESRLPVNTSSSADDPDMAVTKKYLDPTD